jgi:hypothetical protein
MIPKGLALAVLISWDICPLGVLLGRILDRDRRVGLESRVEKLGHRLPDLVAASRPVLTEVLDVPLIKNEPSYRTRFPSVPPQRGPRTAR